MTSPETLRRVVSILLWMGLPVVGGYLAWRFVFKRKPEGETLAAALSRRVGYVAILGAVTPMTFIIFWSAALPAGKAAVLPFVGLFGHSLSGFACWLTATGRRLDLPARGACFLGGASSNVLTFGGIVTVLLLGAGGVKAAEGALAELALLRLLEAPFYFLVAWPVAGRISAAAAAPGGTAARRRYFDPVTLFPLAAIVAGFALNLSGVRRPEALDGVAEALVRVNVVLMGFTVGLTLRRAAVARHLRSCLAVSAVKFLLVPAAGVTLAWTLGFRGTTLQVVAIAASMPVAFMAVVAANLFRLDQELVGSLWLFTTLAMMAVVPLLALVLPAIGRF